MHLDFQYSRLEKTEMYFENIYNKMHPVLKHKFLVKKCILYMMKYDS